MHPGERLVCKPFAPVGWAEQEGNLGDGVVHCCLQTPKHPAACALTNQVVEPVFLACCRARPSKGALPVKDEVLERWSPTDVLVNLRMAKLNGELKQVLRTQRFDLKTWRAQTVVPVQPNVRAKPTAEAGAVSPD